MGYYSETERALDLFNQIIDSGGGGLEDCDLLLSHCESWELDHPEEERGMSEHDFAKYVIGRSGITESILEGELGEKIVACFEGCLKDVAMGLGEGYTTGLTQYDGLYLVTSTEEDDD